MKNFAKLTAVALTITVLGLSACAKKTPETTTTTPDATTTPANTTPADTTAKTTTPPVQ
jgi:hypothetical protein